MKFAVISDIHSNLFALESVLEDIKREQINNIYCTGDIVGYLTDPNGVIDCLKQHNIMSILGNHDEKYIQQTRLTDKEISDLDEVMLQKSGSFYHNNQLLTDENRLYLRNLPRNMLIKLEHWSIQLVHGSPDHISTYLYEEDDKTEIAKNSLQNVIIFGHTHIPYHQIVEEVHFINPGSVGKPKDGDERASYVIVSAEENLSIEFKKVSYNLDQMVLDIESSPWISNELIMALKRGK